MYSQSGNHNQPAEVFRKDLISAMKLPDSAHLDHDEYFLMADTWKPEWEKGVQVPVNPDRVPWADVEEVRPKTPGIYKIPRKLVKLPPKGNEDEDDKDMKGFWQSLEAVCKYDLDDTDRVWLAMANSEREESGYPAIDEYTMERIVEECETQCHSNIEHAIQTEEGLGIEYDEDVICDVCRAPDCEEGNEMVFCDKCDVCVHQACYGIINVPEGTWMCRTCALGIQPACLLCGKKGGVMKSTRSGTKWSHVSCALWVPEVSIGCVDRMEPVTKISQIPASRWALVCNLCRVRTGACIQCSVKTCKTAYHVTCGFENSLEMKTFLDEDSEVRFKSFCLKHCSKKPDVDSPRKQGIAKKEKTQEEKANDRVIRIQRIMEEFYDYAESPSVAAALGMMDDIDTIDLLVQYWKLKRRANFNKPLISFRKEDETPSENEEYNLTARLKMFVHLRQDLERVRNLCYMVQKREKLSKQYLKLKHQIFKKQCEVFDGDTSDLTKDELNLFVNADELSSKERVNERLDKLQKCQSGISDDDASDANSPKACHKPLENHNSDSRRAAERSLGHSDADVSDLESEEEKHCLIEKFGTSRDRDLESTKQEVGRSHTANTKNRIKRFKRINGKFAKNSVKKVSAHRTEQYSDNVFSDDTEKQIAPECRNGVDVTTRHKNTDALREIDAKENNDIVCKGKRLSGSRREEIVEKENDESSETELLRRTKHNDTSISQSEQLYIDNNSDSNLSSDLRTLSLGKTRRNQNNKKSRTKEWIEDVSDDSSNFEEMKISSGHNTNKLNHLKSESDDSNSERDQKPKKNRRRSRQMSGNHKIVKNKTFAKDNESDDSIHSVEKDKNSPRKQMQSKNSTVNKTESLKKKTSISKTVEVKCAKTNNIKIPVRTKAMRKILPARVKHLVNKLRESANKKNDVIRSKDLAVENVDAERDSDEFGNRPARTPRKCNRTKIESSSKVESTVPTSNKDIYAEVVKSDRESDESISRPTRHPRKCSRARVDLSSKDESSTSTSDKRTDAEVKSERDSDELMHPRKCIRGRVDLSLKEESSLSTSNKVTAEIKSDRDSDDSITRATRQPQKCIRGRIDPASKEKLSLSPVNKHAELNSDRESDDHIRSKTKQPRKCIRERINLSLKEEPSMPKLDKLVDAEVKSNRESDKYANRQTKHPRKCIREKINSSKEEPKMPLGDKLIDAEVKSDRERDGYVNHQTKQPRKCIREKINLSSKDEPSMPLPDKLIDAEVKSDEYVARQTRHPRKCIRARADLSLKEESSVSTNNKNINEEVKSDRDSDESVLRLTRNPRRCVRTKIESSSKEDAENNIDTNAEIRINKKPTLNTCVPRLDTKSELKTNDMSKDVINNVDLFGNTTMESQEEVVHCNTNYFSSVNVGFNHVEQLQSAVLKTSKALPMKPKRRTISVNANADLTESETKMPRSLRRSKRTTVEPKSDLEPSSELNHLPNEIICAVPVSEEPPIHQPNLLLTDSFECLQEPPNSVHLPNSSSDTTINELPCGYVASPQQSVHLELDEESSSSESHFGIRKTITDFLAHGDSSSAESNTKTIVVPRTAKRLTRSVRNAVIKQLPLKEHRSSTESEDDTRVVQKQVIAPPPLIKLEHIQKEVEKLPSPARNISVAPSPTREANVAVVLSTANVETLPAAPAYANEENVAVAPSPAKEENVAVAPSPAKEENVADAYAKEENVAVAPPPLKEENTSSSDSDDNHHSHGSSGESDSGSQSSSSSSSSNSDSKNSSSSSSESSESFHTCDSGSESVHGNSDKEESEEKVAKRKGLRRSTRVQTQQQQQTKEINSTNALSTDANEDPYHEDHIDAELDTTSSPIIDKTFRKRTPEGNKRKEPQNVNTNAFAKKPRRNGSFHNSKKIDSYFKPIAPSAENEKTELVPKLIIRIPECIQKSPTKLKIRVPTSPYNAYNSPYRGDDFFQKKRIKTNHVNDTDLDNHKIKCLNPKFPDVSSIVSSPETRGARRRIDLELNSNSKTLDRAFENVDNEISICRSSREPSPGSESPQKPELKTERLVLRRTTGGNYQVSQGSQR